MVPGFDPASVVVAGGDFPNQVLGQFEPDFDGTWEVDGGAAAAGTEPLDDSPWIVWADAALESAWAANELASEWLAVARLAGTR